jgi:hypothetical protein
MQDTKTEVIRFTSVNHGKKSMAQILEFRTAECLQKFVLVDLHASPSFFKDLRDSCIPGRTEIRSLGSIGVRLLATYASTSSPEKSYREEYGSTFIGRKQLSLTRMKWRTSGRQQISGSRRDARAMILSDRQNFPG